MIVPAPITPETLKRLRRAMGVTQQEFAQRLGVSIGSVQAWEQAQRQPKGLYRRAVEDKLREYRIDPDGVVGGVNRHQL